MDKTRQTKIFITFLKIISWTRFTKTSGYRKGRRKSKLRIKHFIRTYLENQDYSEYHYCPINKHKRQDT